MKTLVAFMLIVSLTQGWYAQNKTYIQTEVAKIEQKAEIANQRPTLASRLGVKPRVMIVTAYDPGPISCGYWSRFHRTRTGMKVRRGVIAVDPRVIPFHTRLFVEGYGFGYAEDTGSAIKGNHIDVFFNSYWTAKKWGRQKKKVYILGKDFPIEKSTLWRY